MTEYNRDGDSFRSPLSNTYFPALAETNNYPSEGLRTLEVSLNAAFQEYLHMYFNSSGVVSAFVWQLDEDIKKGFSVAVVLKKTIISEKGIKDGEWNSTNTIDVKFESSEGKTKGIYSIVTTMVVGLSLNNNVCGEVCLSGKVTHRKVEENTLVAQDDWRGHVTNIGQLVEEQESKCRNEVEELYFNKTKEVGK